MHKKVLISLFTSEEQTLPILFYQKTESLFYFYSIWFFSFNYIITKQAILMDKRFTPINHKKIFRRTKNSRKASIYL